jgi:DME family drug/metabolite transporter
MILRCTLATHEPWGLRTTPAAVAAILTLLEPLISTLLAVVLLNEHLAPSSLLGGLILLSSVLLLYRHAQP